MCRLLSQMNIGDFCFRAFLKLYAWIWWIYTFYMSWSSNFGKKAVQLQSLFITQLGHRHCLGNNSIILDINLGWLNICCACSFTILWSINVFINDFTPCLRVKKFCQIIRVRVAHSLKISQLSSDVNCHPILQEMWYHSAVTGKVSRKIWRK